MDHFNLVKRLLQYLKGSVGRGIIMKKNESTQITGYCDVDWAGNSIDRKSTTGYCIFVGGNLVTWKSKKQAVVARSSTEAEYRAMTSTACELIWLKALKTLEIRDMDNCYEVGSFCLTPSVNLETYTYTFGVYALSFHLPEVYMVKLKGLSIIYCKKMEVVVAKPLAGEE
ncbi:uncharacterized mitochondrial protein AtMg00810-like [Pyrus x bretschneideri]|uniref:uncharacterized mitochondrial protein AtMg00810-like n=1 Tax=Pyrus x bretschneideri TaxID=225117 RepID=UPI00202E4DD3|nr:uncharacterized mitochondrial protein AtMg00810-like [Pyrus x bretschneideri]